MSAKGKKTALLHSRHGGENAESVLRCSFVCLFVFYPPTPQYLEAGKWSIQKMLMAIRAAMVAT